MFQTREMLPWPNQNINMKLMWKNHSLCSEIQRWNHGHWIKSNLYRKRNLPRSSTHVISMWGNNFVIFVQIKGGHVYGWLFYFVYFSFNFSSKCLYIYRVLNGIQDIRNFPNLLCSILSWYQSNSSIQFIFQPSLIYQQDGRKHPSIGHDFSSEC